MRIRLKALGLYACGLCVLALAGSYFGSFALILFRLMLLLPVLSLLLLAVWAAGARHSQSFSTEHPVKGQSVAYAFTLANESPLPLSAVEVRFRTVTPFRGITLPDFTASLGPLGSLRKDYVIQCPYRGVYTVGLDRIALRGLLGVVELRLAAYARTFYVFPRIIELSRFSARISVAEAKGDRLSAAGLPDWTLFSRLREYRPGEPVRHISWRKFAATGRPYLKDYESSAGVGVRIYLDLRKPAQGEEEAFALEDTSVEILVALVKHFLTREVPVTVSAPGREVFWFAARDREAFPPFYASTVNLQFQDTVSPALLYAEDGRRGAVSSPSAIFITHLADPDILALLEDSLGTERTVVLVLNRTGMGDAERGINQSLCNRLRGKGAQILAVEGADSIREDLERPLALHA